VGTAFCAGSLLAFAGGCSGEKGDPRLSERKVEEAYEFVLDYRKDEYTRIERSPDVPEYVKDGYEEGLEYVRERRVSRAPHILFAALDRNRSDDGWHLTLDMLELDFDTSGLLVIERDPVSGTTLLVEKYPLWLIAPEMWEDYKGPHLWRTAPRLPVAIRKNETGACRKDIDKWAAWKENPSLDTWPPAPLWISLPSKTRRVEIAIYDEAGHVSNPVEVHVFRGTADAPTER
jgi:hypothetical protein